MELREIVSPETVICGLKASSKKQLLQELSQRAAERRGVDARRAFSALLERERLGSTGMGRGVAIPHARLPDATSIHGVFAKLERPVGFDSVDDEPVDLVFALFAPEDAGADHLRALARVSRQLRDAAICAKLRGATEPSSLFTVLTAPRETRAA